MGWSKSIDVADIIRNRAEKSCVSSSKVNAVSPIALLKLNITDLKLAFQFPLNCWADGGLNFHR